MVIDHKKNAAFELVIPMVDSATPASFKTGLSPTDTAYYKDGAGAWTSLAITDTFAEIGTTGVYEISLAAGEMNHDWIIIKVTAAGAADTFVTFRMFTRDVDDVSTFNASSDTVDLGKISGDATAADNLEADYDGTGYAKTASTISTATVVTNDVGITQAGADKVWSSTTRQITGLTAAAIKSIWDQLTSGLTTAGSIGKKLADWVLGTDDMVKVSADVHTSGQTIAGIAGTKNTFDDLNDLSTAQVNAEVDTALADIYLDQLVLRSGTAQAGAVGTITLDAGASATDDYYKHAICALTGGTGAGQAQIIDSYVGATKVATMAANWATAPDNTTEFVLLPLGTIPGASAPTAAQVADAVWNETRGDHDAAGSVGEGFLDILAATAPKKKVANKSTSQTKVYKEDGITVRYTEQVQAGGTDDEVEVVKV